jgi:uncharacterized metal-binding protein YceD (DUF177 family)
MEGGAEVRGQYQSPCARCGSTVPLTSCYVCDPRGDEEEEPEQEEEDFEDVEYGLWEDLDPDDFPP